MTTIYLIALAVVKPVTKNDLLRTKYDKQSLYVGVYICIFVSISRQKFSRLIFLQAFQINYSQRRI